MNLKLLCVVFALWAVSITTYVVLRPAFVDPQQTVAIAALQQNNEALQKQVETLTAELKKQTEFMAQEAEAREKDEAARKKLREFVDGIQVQGSKGC